MLRLAGRILQDPSLVLLFVFEWLLSGQWLCYPVCRTQRRKATFVPKVVQLLNSQPTHPIVYHIVFETEKKNINIYIIYNSFFACSMDLIYMVACGLNEFRRHKCIHVILTVCMTVDSNCQCVVIWGMMVFNTKPQLLALTRPPQVISLWRSTACDRQFDGYVSRKKSYK